MRPPSLGVVLARNPVVLIQLTLSLAVVGFCIGMLARPGITCEQESTYLPVLTSTLAYWLPGPAVKDLFVLDKASSDVSSPSASLASAEQSKFRELQGIVDAWKRGPQGHVVLQMDQDGAHISMELQKSSPSPATPASAPASAPASE